MTTMNLRQSEEADRQKVEQKRQHERAAAHVRLVAAAQVRDALAPKVALEPVFHQ